MTVSSPEPGTAKAQGRRVIVLPIEPGLLCLRGLSPSRLRFEVEYGLERGTTANSFLFSAGTSPTGQAVPPVLLFPPGESFAEPFLEQLAAQVPKTAALKVVVGHVNPNRVALLRRLARADAGGLQHRRQTAGRAVEPGQTEPAGHPRR